MILVRSTSEEGLKVLPDKVRRSNALTMKVLQAKGLEFEDVLVCDFLSSMADNAREFRVLLSYLKDLEEHPAAVEEARQIAAQASQYGGAGSSFLQSIQWQQKLGGSKSKGHLQRRLLEDVTLTAADKASLIDAMFDPSQHSGLIEELKRLYVAVTRAKSNLAFFESNQLARAALYYYLRRLGLAVEVKTSLVYAQDCLLSNSITSNTPADWVERGMNLMQQQDWAIAAHCFAQAKDHLRHAACKANHMLCSKSGQDHEAAVLLVEAAAGASKRHKQLTTGGSDGLMPITADDYTAWLHTAALVFEQRLDRVPEALALYCQIQKFAQVAPLAARLRADADRLAVAAQDLQRLQGLSQAAGKQASQLAQQMLQQQQQLKKAIDAVVEAAASAKSSAPAQQAAAVPVGKQQQQQRQSAGGASPAAAAAARLAAMQLHTACQQLLAHGLTARQLMEQAARLSAGVEGQSGAAAAVSSARAVASATAGGPAQNRSRHSCRSKQRAQQRSSRKRKSGSGRRSSRHTQSGRPGSRLLSGRLLCTSSWQRSRSRMHPAQQGSSRSRTPRGMLAQLAHGSSMILSPWLTVR